MASAFLATFGHCNPIRDSSLSCVKLGSTRRKVFVEINAALGVSAFVLAATVGAFRIGLLVMIAASAGTHQTLRVTPAMEAGVVDHFGV